MSYSIIACLPSRPPAAIPSKLCIDLAHAAIGVTRDTGGIGWLPKDVESNEAVKKIALWFEDRLKNPLISIFAAIHHNGVNDDIVGSVQLVRNDSFHAGAARHRAAVSKLFVLPECRGRGVARSLLDMLIKQARAEQLKQLVLDVRSAPGQAAAINLYSSLGFEEFGRQSNYALVGDQMYDGVHMALDLRY